MTEQTIICPRCKCEIEITKVMEDQIKEKMHLEIDAELKAKEEVFQVKEQALKEKEHELEKQKADIDAKIESRLKEESAKLKEESDKKAREDVAVHLKLMEEELTQNKQKLTEAQNAELEYRRLKTQLEEKASEMELQMKRALDNEREEIKNKALEKFNEENELKNREKDLKIESMRQKIEELSIKASQGTNLGRGEAMEQSIEDMLGKKFTDDEIEAIDRGKKGADVLQCVYDGFGNSCGSILWESKNTLTWQEKWISKLKDDRREAKADIAIIVTKTLPKGINNFGVIDGVWITDYSSFIGVGHILRMSLLEIAAVKVANVGKNEKMEYIYQYLTGPEFRQRVQAIIDPFLTMKKDLDHEKASMTRMWAKREKEINKVIDNASGLYGDLQGIVGSSLPEIESLELKQLSSGDE